MNEALCERIPLSPAQKVKKVLQQLFVIRWCDPGITKFYNIKVGFEGVYISRTRFPDVVLEITVKLFYPFRIKFMKIAAQAHMNDLSIIKRYK